MLSVAILHAIDAATIAKRLCSTITDTQKNWLAKPYPLLNEEDSVPWTAIKNGTLKANVVVFLASEQFLQNNKQHLSNLIQPNNTKYRFITITIGRSISFPKMQLPLDIELSLEPSNYNHEEIWDKTVSELLGYCTIVEIANQNNENIKKEKRERSKKQTSLLLGIMLIYLAGIVCAMAIVFTDSNELTRSSAEMVLVFMSIFSALFISAASYFVFSGIQKRRDLADQTEFGNDLDMALSNNPHRVRKEEAYSTTLEVVSSIAPLVSYDLLDAVFSLIKSRGDDKAQDTDLVGDPVDAEMSRTIGSESYLPLGHLKLNWKQMKGYYDISKKQATSAFVFAIIICFIGIAIFAFSVVSPFIPAFASNNILIPIVGTIGGTIVELFAGTILIVYKKTLSQMNLYHEALSDYQRYLSCINLVSMISDVEKRDQLFSQIISSEMNKVSMTHNADTSP